MLYQQHERALSLLFQNLINAVKGTSEVFIGTPGSVVERKNAGGVRFYAHKYLDGAKKNRERYLAAPIGDVDADRIAEAMRDKITDARQLGRSFRMLAREGFNTIDPSAYATLATISNHDIFNAGGVLIGSHAFGALLNHAGVRSTPYATEDIDIARPQKLAFASLPEASFLDVLRSSGLEFFGVPGFKPTDPPTSFKRKGRSRFIVDLLVPSLGRDFATIPVPELKAHATALPFLDFLLEENQWGMVISRSGGCPVRLPLPERYATHKLIVSQLRTGRDAKVRKDLHQASVLAAYLADEHPGALTDAVDAVSDAAIEHVSRGLRQAQKLLKTQSSAAWDEWSEAIESRRKGLTSVSP